MLDEFTKRTIKNVKALNKSVKYMQKYLKEHSKEVYQVYIDSQGFEPGQVKFTIIFNPNDFRLKEAQILLQEKKKK